jgi:DamX protein
VVQLLGAYNKRSLANLIARHRDTLDIGQFSYIHTTNNGRDWFVLLYGNYADFDAAMAAMDSLPQRLQKSGPYVRTVAGALKSAARS